MKFSSYSCGNPISQSSMEKPNLFLVLGLKLRSIKGTEISSIAHDKRPAIVRPASHTRTLSANAFDLHLACVVHGIMTRVTDSAAGITHSSLWTVGTPRISGTTTRGMQIRVRARNASNRKSRCVTAKGEPVEWKSAKILLARSVSRTVTGKKQDKMLFPSSLTLAMTVFVQIVLQHVGLPPESAMEEVRRQSPPFSMLTCLAQSRVGRVGLAQAIGPDLETSACLARRRVSSRRRQSPEVSQAIGDSCG